MQVNLKKISIVCQRHRSGPESKGQAIALGLIVVVTGRGEKSLEVEQKVCVYVGGFKSDQQKNSKESHLAPNYTQSTRSFSYHDEIE